MKEDLLHYLWRHKLFYSDDLKTVIGEEIVVVSTGAHNHNSGPDFFNAKIKIGTQLWAGNVEIHVKSSDWYVHNHEKDENYDNVILHVVWEHDVEIHNSENSVIPTLELKEYVSEALLRNYQKLFSRPERWINCEKSISSVDAFVISNWFERLYFERLERKSVLIYNALEETKFDWETVLFQLLARNFGLKVNAEAFFEMASLLDFTTVKRERISQQNLESLFFGQLGMLNKSIEDPYYIDLKKEYAYQQKKYKLMTQERSFVQFFRLRPTNFPTIRISQFAGLYSLHQNLFSKLMQTENTSEVYDLFSVTASKFWKTHYTFEKESPKRTKKLTKSFIDLLMINTIIPLKFVYLKHIGKLDESEFLELIQQVKSEENAIIKKFDSFRKAKSKSAFESQAILELKNEYCSQHKCLQCAIGNSLLKS